MGDRREAAATRKKCVTFAAKDKLVQIHHVETRGELEQAGQLSALFVSRQELHEYHIRRRCLVRLARHNLGGDMSQLPCGGRGLEKYRTSEHAEQARIIRSFVICSVLHEQERQALHNDDHHDDHGDGGASLQDGAAEEIRRASEFHSQWSCKEARRLGRADEKFVAKMRDSFDVEMEERQFWSHLKRLRKLQRHYSHME